MIKKHKKMFAVCQHGEPISVFQTKEEANDEMVYLLSFDDHKGLGIKSVMVEYTDIARVQ